MAKAEEAIPIRRPDLMTQIYLHCTLESGAARVFMHLRTAQPQNPVRSWYSWLVL